MKMKVQYRSDWSSLICSQDQVEGLMQQAADEAG